MIVYVKYIRQIILITLINSVLYSFSASATECGVLKLQNNRSSGVIVKANQCDELSKISIGTIFELSAQGRLWLKANASKYSQHEFQMICQNRTKQTIALEFSEPFLPWLSFAKMNNCSGWVDNKLSCEGNNGEKKGLYCVLAFIQPRAVNEKEKIERTSSVKMRDVSQLFEADSQYDSFDKQQFVETLVAELKLCKNLNGIPQEVQINWLVQMARVKSLKVLTPVVQNKEAFTECIEAVITTTWYPLFSKEVSFDSVF